MSCNHVSSSPSAVHSHKPSTEPEFLAPGRAHEDARRIQQQFSRRSSTIIEDVELIRAVPARTVMQGFAKHFKSSETSAEDHKLATRVQNFDFFLSHSWRASRLQKWATLMITFRIHGFILGAFLMSTAVFVLSVAGILPVMSRVVRFQDVPEAVVPYSMWCFSCCMPGALLGVWIQDLLESSQCTRSPQVFLDKLSISQHDEVLKARGIESIGLFIRRSRRVIVLWSPEYFSRLWCCFEIAALLKTVEDDGTNGRSSLDKRLVMRPVALGQVALAYTVLVYLATFLSNASYSFDIVSSYGNVVYVVIFTPCVILFGLGQSFLRHYLLSRRALNMQLEQFSFEQAECFSERDRTIIKVLLDLWFSDKAMHGDSVSYFNSMVRGRVKMLCQRALGGLLPLWPVFPACTMFCCGSLDLLAARMAIPDEHFAANGTLAGSTRAIDSMSYAVYLLSQSWLMTPASLAFVLVLSGFGGRVFDSQSIPIFFKIVLGGLSAIPGLLPYFTIHYVFSYLKLHKSLTAAASLVVALIWFLPFFAPRGRRQVRSKIDAQDV